MRQLLFSLFAMFLLMPVLALAQLDPEDTGLTTTGDEVYGSAPDDIGTFIGSNIITPVLGLVGVIYLVLMIYAGFLWMTGGGTTSQIEKAKNIMIASTTGVVLITAAYAITKFVFDAIS